MANHQPIDADNNVPNNVLVLPTVRINVNVNNLVNNNIITNNNNNRGRNRQRNAQQNNEQSTVRFGHLNCNSLFNKQAALNDIVLGDKLDIIFQS
jgi:hypothetical protein